MFYLYDNINFTNLMIKGKRGLNSTPAFLVLSKKGKEGK
jgi:hypothetical protein